ncbi:MAG: TetR/AcrR family transcriptional regulator [Pseudomonadota bacterium]
MPTLDQAPPPSAKTRATRERLLVAGQAALIDGRGALEMSDVARRAGVSAGLAYHHFRSKTGLIAAIVEAFHEPLLPIAMGPSGRCAESWRRLEKDRLRRMIAHYYAHPLAPLIVGRLGREPEILDLERRRHDAMLEEGARNLAAAQAKGVIAADLDPEIAISLVLGGMRQALVRALSRAPRPDPDMLCDQLWRLIESALRLNGAKKAAPQSDRASPPTGGTP